ncbi:SAPK-interacting protein 1 isoform X2 [Amblyomma americanum]
MALYDDVRFVLSHVRHSFVTCDDTGLCELAMLSDADARAAWPQPPQVTTDLAAEAEQLQLQQQQEMSQSYDIVSEMEFIGAHRRRSNTAQRLERLKKERRLQGKLRHIVWKDQSPKQLSALEVDTYFPRKESAARRSADGGATQQRSSALARQLEKFPVAPNNPFNEYTRFDGKVSEPAHRRINVFMSMLPPDERGFPIMVSALPGARIHDLIGLVCWHYTNEGRSPKLKPSVSHYCLRIAEESGEIDEDFPALDPREPVTKFEFPFLALAEVEKEDFPMGPLLTFHTKDGFTKVQIPSLDATLREVLDQMLKKRKGLLRSLGPEFHVEDYKEVGIPIDLDSTIRTSGTLEFTLVSEDAALSASQPDDYADRDMTAMEAHLYQAFNVALVPRIGRNTQVQLGISGEKVEITPLHHKTKNRLWTWQPKAVTHNMNEIAACEFVHRKHSVGSLERCVVKVVYLSGGEFKNHVFETDPSTASVIRSKLGYILVMRTSLARTQYLALKERKLLRKQASFLLPS